jgi:hypothetical protein
MMMLNDDGYIYGNWYFLLEGVLSGLITGIIAKTWLFASNKHVNN